MTTEHTTEHTSTRRGFNPSSTILWATAFLLGGMILTQAGRLPSNAAHAGNANNNGTYTVLTARSGTGDGLSTHDLLYVIDNRDEVLLVYEIEDARKNTILLRDGGSLDTLFRTSRR